MSGENTTPSNDLTTPENVAKGQEVYARIVTGEVKDAAAELDRVYGREK